MSVFSPMNVNAGQDQKKALLQQLLDQYQAHAQRAAGLAGAASGPATAGAVSPGARPFGGVGHVTAALPNLAQSLIQRLGPGGFGRPIAGVENSGGQGAPVNLPAWSNPHAGGAPNAPVGPIGPAPSAPTPAAPAPAASGSSGALPLGNGLVYHPVFGIIPGGTSKAYTA